MGIFIDRWLVDESSDILDEEGNTVFVSMK